MKRNFLYYAKNEYYNTIGEDRGIFNEYMYDYSGLFDMVSPILGSIFRNSRIIKRIIYKRMVKNTLFERIKRENHDYDDNDFFNE